MAASEELARRVVEGEVRGVLGSGVILDHGVLHVDEHVGVV